MKYFKTKTNNVLNLRTRYSALTPHVIAEVLKRKQRGERGIIIRHRRFGHRQTNVFLDSGWTVGGRQT